MDVVLKLNRVSVSFENSDFMLYPVSLTIHRGEIISVVGESGSGKSTFLKAITCLSDKNAIVKGEAILNGVDLYQLTEKELKKKRFKEFSIAFQNSAEYLNPLLSLREQLLEVLKKADFKDLEAAAGKIMEEVGLCAEDLNKKPAELSGGMVQKFLMASAVALKPDVVVLDEPTGSLDMESKNELLKLIERLNQEYNMAFIIVTHDLKLAEQISSDMYVMYRGQICECGKTKEILKKPRHPYTRGLIASSMEINPYRDIWGIRLTETENHAGCPFYSRCTQSVEGCSRQRPKLKPDAFTKNRFVACNRGGIVKVLYAEHIDKAYGKNQVLSDCGIDVYGGEIVSIVGKSGSGKSTFSNIIAGFLKKDSGKIVFDQEEIDYKRKHNFFHDLQIVLQDSNDAINPRMTVLEVVSEAAKLIENKDYSNEVVELLRELGLPSDEAFLNRRAGYLSGGQKQRLCIARALMTKPRLMIADEPTSMLDTSSKANLLRLLKGLQNGHGFSMIIVTHDWMSAVKISDRIYYLEHKELKEVDNDFLLERLA